ncbi:MAG: hypothetical protein ABI921_08740 [Panacibacter sp.]
MAPHQAGMWLRQMRNNESRIKDAELKIFFTPNSSFIIILSLADV